jgi:hypothetical protein
MTELRIRIFKLIQHATWPWLLHKTSNLNLRRIYSSLGCLATNPQGARGPVCLAQTCGLIRAEWLPLLMLGIRIIGMNFRDAMDYLPDIGLPPHRTIGSIVQQTDCKTTGASQDRCSRIRIPVCISSSKWHLGIDIMPLLRLVAQAQIQQPMSVDSHDSAYNQALGRECDDLLNPALDKIEGRDHFLQTVERIHMAGFGLALVFKAGGERYDIETEVRALLESFGIERGAYGVPNLEELEGGVDKTCWVHLG